MRPIDADALKEKARVWIPHYDASVVMNLFDLIDNLADNMPTIEPKKGKWISNVGGFSCSNCGYQTDDDEIGNWDITFGKWVYCPHCGARMERSEE